jgi:GDP-L-fucose synthase
MREDALLTGTLEATNEPYAIAKIAGIKLCESYNRQYGSDFRSVMPTNLYGPGDNYHPSNSHVIPGLIRRFVEAADAKASVVTVWGSGQPLREFLHVDDMAAACLHVMGLTEDALGSVTRPMLSHINVGSGEELTIGDLSRLIARIAGFQGEIAFDAAMPDGTPRKLMDSRLLRALGWRPAIGIEQGLRREVDAFRRHAMRDPIREN